MGKKEGHVELRLHCMSILEYATQNLAFTGPKLSFYEVFVQQNLISSFFGPSECWKTAWLRYANWTLMGLWKQHSLLSGIKIPTWMLPDVTHLDHLCSYHLTVRAAETRSQSEDAEVDYGGRHSIPHSHQSLSVVDKCSEEPIKDSGHDVGIMMEDILFNSLCGSVCNFSELPKLRGHSSCPDTLIHLDMNTRLLQPFPHLPCVWDELHKCSLLKSHSHREIIFHAVNCHICSRNIGKISWY